MKGRRMSTFEILCTHVWNRTIKPIEIVSGRGSEGIRGNCRGGEFDPGTSHACL
jgi:hypothetical protein